MALTTAPDFTSGVLTAAKLQALSDAINERTPILALTTRTANVGTFTAETELDQVTASLVVAQVYRVVSVTSIMSSVADGYTRNRIREDTSAGTQIQLVQVSTAAITAAQNQLLYMEVYYTAVSTGNKTFVATGSRQAGTGNITSVASATNPSYMYVMLASGG